MNALPTVTYSLYRVLTMTAKTYTEALLKDESSHDGHLQPISDSHPDG